MPEPITRAGSQPQDIVIDQKNRKFYIADEDIGPGGDGSHAAIIIIDIDTGRARRVLDGDKSTVPENVPITVDVFTARQIQSAGIESPRDFVAMVPNMTLVEVQNVGNSFITVRGISQARNSEPSVAVLVDGVLETNPYQFDQELTDIRQIEVLKGPQGALYGRNAIGGAIIIHTVDPSDHFEGTGKVGAGNGVSQKAQFAVSGPVEAAITIETGSSDREANMWAFARRALELLESCLLSVR